MAENSDKADSSNQEILSEILKNQKLILEQNKAILEIKEKEQENEKKKIEVPREIRDAVRQAYKDIIEADDDDDEEQTKAWNFSKTRRDSGNIRISLEITKMVKGWHPDAPKGSIRAAVQRYYTSLYEANLRKKKNKDEKHRSQQRRYERRKRKLKARKRAMDMTTQISQEDKKKYLKVMDMQYMSSENSHSDEEHGSIFITSKLPWRAEFVERLFGALDKKHRSSLSKRSKHMERERYEAGDRVSLREMPRHCPNWAIDADYKKKLLNN